MTTTMPMIKSKRARTCVKLALRPSLRTDWGDAVMRHLRRAAITRLDMRTEFEILDTVEDLSILHSNGSVVIVPSLMGRVRQLVSLILDPWTEFRTQG